MILDFYHGEHSVIFGDKHSWNDWHLIPSTPPVVSPPNPRTNYIDIPGTYGKLDLSEILTGYPLYENRTGDFTFVYIPDYGPSRRLYDEILNEVHGKRLKVILTDDPEYFYEGRITVKELSLSKEYSGFSFSYTFDPFKLQTHASPGYSNIAVNGTKDIDIVIGSGPMREVPGITASTTMTAVLTRASGTVSTATIVPQTHRYPELYLGPGLNVLSLTGTGTVSLDVRKGSL